VAASGAVFWFDGKVAVTPVNAEPLPVNDPENEPDKLELAPVKIMSDPTPVISPALVKDMPTKLPDVNVPAAGVTPPITVLFTVPP